MNRLLQSIILSLVLHALILFGINSIVNNEKINHSDNIGNSQVKTTVKIVLKPKKKKQPTKSLKDKKKVAETDKVNSLENIELQDQKMIDQGKESDLAKYLSSVRDLIVKHKYMNRISKKLKLKGRVELSFSITWPNNISNLNITKPSVHTPLNESAITGIKSIGDLPNIPKSLKNEVLTAEIAVIYE
jgi:hypothetical protein